MTDSGWSRFRIGGSWGLLVLWASMPAAAQGVASPATAAAGTRPAGFEPGPARAWLIEQFDRQVTQAVDAALAGPVTNDQGGIAWGHSYVLAALAEMLDATREARYAELFMRLGNAIIAARDDRHERIDVLRERVVKGWGSTKYTQGRHYVWAVHTGMIVAPMAQFASTVRRDERLRTRYAADAERFLAVAAEGVAEHADQYREGPGREEGYLFGLHLEKHLPLNQQNTVARTWVHLGDLTGEAGYRERTRALATFLKNRLRLTEDQAYVWAYAPPLDGPGTTFEDNSHAAINADFIVLCVERGIVFDREDLARLEKTFLTRVLLEDGDVSDHLSAAGRRNKYRYAPFVWARLARYNPTIRDRILVHARRQVEAGESSMSQLVGFAHLVAALPGDGR